MEKQAGARIEKILLNLRQLKSKDVLLELLKAGWRDSRRLRSKARFLRACTSVIRKRKCIMNHSRFLQEELKVQS